MKFLLLLSVCGFLPRNDFPPRNDRIPVVLSLPASRQSTDGGDPSNFRHPATRRETHRRNNLSEQQTYEREQTTQPPMDRMERGLPVK